MNRFSVWLLLLLFSWSLLQAAVLQEPFETLARRSELIFEGEALSREVVADPRSGLPWTRVTFLVREVLKGDPSLTGRRLFLYFLGGRIGERELRLPELHYPEVGEEGIYFVRDPRTPYANPLTGWEQGRFLIRKGFVYTASGLPVVDLKGVPPGKSPKLSPGVAGGVVARPLREGEAALSVERFKAHLQEVLQDE